SITLERLRPASSRQNSLSTGPSFCPSLPSSSLYWPCAPSEKTKPSSAASTASDRYGGSAAVSPPTHPRAPPQAPGRPSAKPADPRSASSHLQGNRPNPFRRSNGGRSSKPRTSWDESPLYR